VPAAQREPLHAALFPRLMTSVREITCDGGTTRKNLWRLHDGALVESGADALSRPVTMCVSSQAGCGMNCPFCATGQAGLTATCPPPRSSSRSSPALVKLARGEVPGGPGRVSNVVFRAWANRWRTTSGARAVRG